MSYTPEKNGTAKVISLLAILVACVLMATTFLQVPYRVLWQIGALIFYIFSFELLYRYVLTTYTYAIDGENFIVHKKAGKKQIYVCNVSMKTAIALVKTPHGKAERAATAEQFGRVGIRYNYCQIVAPKDAYSYFFEFNGKVAEVVFQPNESMREKILEILRQVKESAASGETNEDAT